MVVAKKYKLNSDLKHLMNLASNIVLAIMQCYLPCWIVPLVQSDRNDLLTCLYVKHYVYKCKTPGEQKIHQQEAWMIVFQNDPGSLATLSDKESVLTLVVLLLLNC